MAQKTIESEVRAATGKVMASITDHLAVHKIVVTYPYISETAASICIEGDDQRERAAELLRADGWKIVETELYGRPSLVIC